MFDVLLTFPFCITCAFFYASDDGSDPPCHENAWQVQILDEGQWADYGVILAEPDEFISFYGYAGIADDPRQPDSPDTFGLQTARFRHSPKLQTTLPAGEYWFRLIASPNGTIGPAIWLKLPSEPGWPYLQVN